MRDQYSAGALRKGVSASGGRQWQQDSSYAVCLANVMVDDDGRLMAEPRGALLFLLITLCAVFWGSVLLFALGQFWVICEPHIRVPHCPTLMESTLRASAVLLGGAAVFGLAAWIGQRLFR